nr:MAG TPA: protein of unknown function (DUF4711) [Inoviridae sp.]
MQLGFSFIEVRGYRNKWSIVILITSTLYLT